MVSWILIHLIMFCMYLYMCIYFIQYKHDIYIFFFIPLYCWRNNDFAVQIYTKVGYFWYMNLLLYVLCERRLQFMYTHIWSVTVRNWMGDGVFHSYIDVRCYHLNINAAVYNPVTHSNVTNWIIGGSELDMPLRICIMSNARWWMHFFFFRWPVLNSLQRSTLPAPENLASSDGFSLGIQCVKIFHHSITGVFYQAS